MVASDDRATVLADGVSAETAGRPRISQPTRVSRTRFLLTIRIPTRVTSG